MTTAPKVGDRIPVGQIAQGTVIFVLTPSGKQRVGGAPLWDEIFCRPPNDPRIVAARRMAPQGEVLIHRGASYEGGDWAVTDYDPIYAKNIPDDVEVQIIKILERQVEVVPSEA